jgi:hypothetical protein
MIFFNKTGLGLIGFQFTVPRTSTLGGMALNLPYLHDSTPHRRSTHSKSQQLLQESCIHH